MKWIDSNTNFSILLFRFIDEPNLMPRGLLTQQRSSVSIPYKGNTEDRGKRNSEHTRQHSLRDRMTVRSTTWDDKSKSVSAVDFRWLDVRSQLCRRVRFRWDLFNSAPAKPAGVFFLESLFITGHSGGVNYHSYFSPCLSVDAYLNRPTQRSVFLLLFLPIIDDYYDVTRRRWFLSLLFTNGTRRTKHTISLIPRSLVPTN